jgi:hypothetical protein
MSAAFGLCLCFSRRGASLRGTADDGRLGQKQRVLSTALRFRALLSEWALIFFALSA